MSKTVNTDHLRGILVQIARGEHPGFVEVSLDGDIKPNALAAAKRQGWVTTRQLGSRGGEFARHEVFLTRSFLNENSSKAPV